MNENNLKDVLYYLDPDSGVDEKLAQGALTGVISAVMAYEECNFQIAVALIRPYLPETINPFAVPESWRKDVLGKWHYIMMGGLSGLYLPSHCDAYESYEDAVESAVQLYDTLDDEYVYWDEDTGITPWTMDVMREELRRTAGFDFESITLVPAANARPVIDRYGYGNNGDFAKDAYSHLIGPYGHCGSGLFGNAYVSIDKCDCPEPWIHGEMDESENWPDYEDEEEDDGEELD